MLAQIAETIRRDLKELAKGEDEGGRIRLNPDFLDAPGSRVELVGVVNRIDRQFIKDPVAGSERHDRCGEISVIYRFSYAAHGVQSRLPMTMNVVFLAVPLDRPAGAATCRDVAARWQAEMDRPGGRTPDAVAASLTEPATGIVAPLAGRDIERIELNFQAYRIRSSRDLTDSGSTAEYVIRVFRWDGARFGVSYLTNQIDRARLLGNPKGDGNSCQPDKAIPLSLSEFRAYLTKSAMLFDLDTGTLNIPEKYLACRATTISPGGPHLAKNQPFWNAPTPAGQIISDAALEAARKAAESPTRRFSFMRSPDDMRTRLNELTCSGCHQARAIAGFHFPGEDREKTPT